MKKMILALVFLAAQATGALAASTPYRFTGPYKWCASYNGIPRNCGFQTLPQCHDTVAGQGDQCVVNPKWTDLHPAEVLVTPII